ncbi:MAG: hypothetical protein CSA81_10610 [Acidobacteria bacterium]|nr:MAG: hypothetical protein CSA81_10610 [Acidobacteriota bacterium]
MFDQKVSAREKGTATLLLTYLQKAFVRLAAEKRSAFRAGSGGQGCCFRLIAVWSFWGRALSCFFREL